LKISISSRKWFIATSEISPHRYNFEVRFKTKNKEFFFTIMKSGMLRLVRVPRRAYSAVSGEISESAANVSELMSQEITAIPEGIARTVPMIDFDTYGNTAGAIMKVFFEIHDQFQLPWWGTVVGLALFHRAVLCIPLQKRKWRYFDRNREVIKGLNEQIKKFKSLSIAKNREEIEAVQEEILRIKPKLKGNVYTPTILDGIQAMLIAPVAIGSALLPRFVDLAEPFLFGMSLSGNSMGLAVIAGAAHILAVDKTKQYLGQNTNPLSLPALITTYACLSTILPNSFFLFAITNYSVTAALHYLVRTKKARFYLGLEALDVNQLSSVNTLQNFYRLLMKPKTNH
jgi:hypothetical protein